MPIHPAQREVEVSTALGPDDVVDRLSALLQARTRKKISRARTGRVELGSRFGYRFWGVFLEKGRAQLPLVVSWAVTAEGAGSALCLSMHSNEGRYAFNPDSLVRAHYAACEARFSQLEADVRRNLA